MSAQIQPTPVRRRAPGAGRPIGSGHGREMELARRIAAYVQALGGVDRVGALMLTDIERCAEMRLLAKAARAKLAAGRTTINDVVKLENAADRAERRLGLPAPNAGAPTGGLHDIVDRARSERANPVEDG
jgi:hypothetical protein